MSIVKPTAAESLAAMAGPLNEADHEARVQWARSLNGREQYRLFDMAKGNPVDVSAFTGEESEVVVAVGKNGLGMFNKFEKRFTRFGDVRVGYNHNEFPSFITQYITGPGHFVAYNSPDVPGEVWIDYRKLVTQRHPDFPPLRGNETGLPALIFGNMVDVIRRVSDHVYIGDAFKNMPREDTPGLLTRIGSMFATAPFVCVVDHK